MSAQKTQLVLPLDFADSSSAEAMVEQLQGLPVVYKVGLQLFIGEGPEFVKRLKGQGHPVFLDLKLHDIPNTVARAVESAGELGVDFLTVHAGGGSPMLEAANESAKKFPGLQVLAVSVLTSLSQKEWDEIGSAIGGASSSKPVEKSVLDLAQLSWRSGVDGLVCSPLELPGVTSTFPKMFTVVPGIRLQGASTDDQSRVMTPEQASQSGASAIVMGRPITQAQNPRQVAEEVLQSIGAL